MGSSIESVFISMGLGLRGVHVVTLYTTINITLSILLWGLILEWSLDGVLDKKKSHIT